MDRTEVIQYTHMRSCWQAWRLGWFTCGLIAIHFVTGKESAHMVPTWITVISSLSSLSPSPWHWGCFAKLSCVLPQELVRCQRSELDQGGSYMKYEMRGAWRERASWRLSWSRIHLQCDPRFGKIPWRREWLPTQ